MLALSCAVLLLVVSAVSAQVPPPHHPFHSAPADLLARIRRSNPASLDFSFPSTFPHTSAAHGRRRSRRLSTSAASPLRVTPVSMGGDPTGRKDSWAALNACLEACLNQSALSPNGFFPGQDTDPAFGPIRDMGGCQIDLEGGEFLLSQPLVVPKFNANMQLGGGSLVASKTFDGDFLIKVGSPGNCSYPQGSCNLDINFPRLFLDGAGVASGMQINSVMGVTVGPGGYFLNFTEYGLQINAGHEVMMDRCWLGETNFDFNHVERQAPPNATAIQINGNDHYILNTIVFSSRVGVEVNGAADYVTGVHVWFPDNNAVAFANTAAFHINGKNNRFNGCYIDGGRAFITPDSNIWTNGFECCQGAAAVPGTTASGITLVGGKIGPGLNIANNEFGGGKIYHIDKLWPSFSSTRFSKEFSGMSAFERATTSGRNCTGSFNSSSANHECIGLKEAPSGAPSLDACAQACCDDALCTVYQYCAKGQNCDGATGTDAQCWTGSSSDCDSKTRKGWQGMMAGQRPEQAPTVSGTRITHNSGGNVGGTQVTMSLTQKNATTWTFDVCDQLVFATVAVVRTHVIAESGFPRAVARPPKGCVVVVETDIPVTGTVTIDVDSSEPDPSFQ